VNEVLLEHGADGWILPLAGFVCAGSRYWVDAEGGDEIDLVVHAEDFSGAAIVGLPGTARPLVLSLVERRALIESAVAPDDSELRLGFEGGDAIVVPPLPDAEAWEIHGPGFHVIGTPMAGRVAVWDASSPTYTLPARKGEEG
jgi:Family of unknown function (DUF6188)